MKLTARDIHECLAYEEEWCKLPRTPREERETRILLESLEDHRLIIPGGLPVPRDVQVLIEQVQSGAPADPPPPGTRTTHGPRSVAPPTGDSHARMAAAVRGTGPAPLRVLTEDRGGARDVAGLTPEERYSLLHQLATGEPSLVLPQLRHVLREHREADQPLPEGTHRKLAAAFTGAAPAAPEGVHERMAKAFGR